MFKEYFLVKTSFISVLLKRLLSKITSLGDNLYNSHFNFSKSLNSQVVHLLVAKSRKLIPNLFLFSEIDKIKF
jgi:hypothetical protein